MHTDIDLDHFQLLQKIEVVSTTKKENKMKPELEDIEKTILLCMGNLAEFNVVIKTITLMIVYLDSLSDLKLSPDEMWVHLKKLRNRLILNYDAKNK